MKIISRKRNPWLDFNKRKEWKRLLNLGQYAASGEASGLRSIGGKGWTGKGGSLSLGGGGVCTFKNYKRKKLTLWNCQNVSYK